MFLETNIKDNQTKTIKQIMLNKKSPIYEELKVKEVLRYLKRKIKNSKHPKEVRYIWISKKTGLTYKQVRRIIDKLVKQDILEKFQAWNSELYRQNYYRFKNTDR